MNRGTLIAVLWLAACAGDSDGKDSGAEPTGDTATVSDATFTRVKAEVLAESCASAGCHGAGTVANGMELVAGGEYAALVDAPSIGKPGETLVVPGDADASYVVLKLEDAAGIAGEPMPYPFGGLAAPKIQLMRDWIDAGALDN